MNNSVKNFYLDEGWSLTKQGVHTDAEMFEDLRESSKEYLKRNRLRLLKYFPKQGERLLDCASGPIQYKEYLEYSRFYETRVCVDFSETALKIAKAKSPNHIQTIKGDIREINLGENSFDTILSIHTLYHINYFEQWNIIERFKTALRDDGTIIIVYSNPKFILEKFKSFIKKFRIKKRLKFTFERFTPSEVKSRFPEAKLIPYRFISGEDMRRIVPDNLVGKLLLNLISRLEPYLPLIFVQYYLIVFKK